jgi:hypothetical protein
LKGGFLEDLDMRGTKECEIREDYMRGASSFTFFTRQYQIKDEMDGTYSIKAQIRNAYRCWSGNLNGRDHFVHKYGGE